MPVSGVRSQRRPPLTGSSEAYRASGTGNGTTRPEMPSSATVGGSPAARDGGPRTAPRGGEPDPGPPLGSGVRPGEPGGVGRERQVLGRAVLAVGQLGDIATLQIDQQ